MTANSFAKYAGASLPLETKTNRTKFLADAMLGSIARKLRFFGFDTLYLVHTDDDLVLETGISENRTILTSDRELFKRIVKANAAGVLVDGLTEIDNLVHILAKSGIKKIELNSADSRCPVCGGTLSQREPNEITDSVPEPIAQRYNRFFQCNECTKVYWEGGHYTRLRTLAKRVNERLARL